MIADGLEDRSVSAPHDDRPGPCSRKARPVCADREERATVETGALGLEWSHRLGDQKAARTATSSVARRAGEIGEGRPGMPGEQLAAAA
ncbi:MAG TPA: hypothetical protein VFQ65_01960, partial [Kofleriaceae bacterium]|nr:hypothetical protein [Kofleriaceae bacterium]